MSLDKQKIQQAFCTLGQSAVKRGEHIRLLLFGGAAMVFLFENRHSTKDVDAVFLAPPEALKVRELARDVAQELGLPEDWLNDAVKGYVKTPDHQSVLFEAPGLTVFSPSLEQLTAMKLSAWRDDIDIADAEVLMHALKSSEKNSGDVWKKLEKFLTPGCELKAKYAFDELWISL